MKRLTFEGNFCDIAQCAETRGGSFCEDGACSQRKVWERLKKWEDLEEQGRVIVMKNPEQDGMARLRELADADRDGRVLVLSETMEDVSALGVAPVVHGQWVLLDECYNEGVYCSACHKKVYKKCYANKKIKSKFCPHCGAKMDGGAENG